MSLCGRLGPVFPSSAVQTGRYPGTRMSVDPVYKVARSGARVEEMRWRDRTVIDGILGIDVCKNTLDVSISSYTKVRTTWCAPWCSLRCSRRVYSCKRRYPIFRRSQSYPSTSSLQHELRFEQPCTQDLRSCASQDTVQSEQRSLEKRGLIYRTGSFAKGTQEAHRSPRCSANLSIC